MVHQIPLAISLQIRFQFRYIALGASVGVCLACPAMTFAYSDRGCGGALVPLCTLAGRLFLKNR